MELECPSEDELLAWAHGRLPSQRRRDLELHIDTCPTCAALLATAAREPTIAPPSRRPIEPSLPPRFDRYVIESRIGRGGMGVVYAALDERLGRRVALKVLRGDRALDVEVLRAEARALAALQHPNVVTVYEVGQLPAGDVYIAMELVPGEDLRRIIARGQLTIDEILDLFTQAGRGLAAAHAALLVHRDFKPDNVLVGTDTRNAMGRVRVTDFGLACVHGTSTVDAGSSTSSGTIERVAGTPAYMAPEQRAAGTPDPRWDQYAFCVALWEALARAKPPKSEAARRRDDAIPGRIRRVLERGLADDPAARHPSMTALLVELGRAQRRSTWVLPLAAGATLVLGVAIASGGGGEERCGAAASTAWWTEGARPRLADALVDPPSAIVGREGARALAHLDRRAERTGDAAQAACLAANDESRTTRCLASARARVEELAGALSDDPGLAVRGLDALVRALPEPESCGEEHGDSAAMIETRDALASARLLVEAGRYDEAVARTGEIVADARMLADADALASALSEHGTALLRAGAWQRAIEVLREAHEIATSAGADEIAADAAYRLAFAQTQLHRPTDALEWIRHAHAACDRIVDPEERIDTELVVGGVHTTVLLALGRTAEARTIAERGLHETEARVGKGDPDLVVALEDLAAVCMEELDLACAETHLVRALALAESAWGEEHPRTAIVVANLGHLEELRGRHEVAMTWFARALRDSEAVLGAHHPDVARAHYNVGVASDRLRDYEMARREFGLALSLFRETLGDEHPVVAMTLHNLGAVALAQQDFSDAEQLYARAQGIVERTLGSSDPQITKSLLGRAESAIGRADGAAALAFIERAEVVERERGTVPDVESLYRLARAQRASGDEPGARETADVALSLANADEAETLREFIAAGPRAPTLAAGR